MNKIELKNTTDHLKQIVNQVTSKANSFDKDLPRDIRQQRITALWKEQEKIVNTLIAKLNGAIADYRQARRKASDGNKMMLKKALTESDRATTGDLIIAHAMEGLNFDDFNVIIESTQNPFLILAAKSEINLRDLAPEKKIETQKVLNKKAELFVDHAAIKYNAGLELEALEALKQFHDAKDVMDPADKLNFARELVEVQKLVA